MLCCLCLSSKETTVLVILSSRLYELPGDTDRSPSFFFSSKEEILSLEIRNTNKTERV